MLHLAYSATSVAFAPVDASSVPAVAAPVSVLACTEAL